MTKSCARLVSAFFLPLQKKFFKKNPEYRIPFPTCLLLMEKLLAIIPVWDLFLINSHMGEFESVTEAQLGILGCSE